MSEKANSNADARRRSKLENTAIVVLLVFTSLAAFYPALDAGFINYDDPAYVLENPQVQSGLTVESVRWAFTTFYFSNWHPLTWLSHMLDWELYGSHPMGHHLTSILLHAANGVLLYLGLLLATGRRWEAAFVAILFLVHPLRVESVAWVSERKDVLSTFFGLAALLLYIRFAQLGKGKLLFFAFVAFLLSLMSKPMLVTMPFLLLLLDYWPLKRLSVSHNATGVAVRRILLEKLPFFIASVASSVVTLLAQRTELAPAEILSLGDRLANAAWAYVAYLGKIFWPAKLAVFYPHPGDRSLLVVLGAAALLVLFTVIALNRARRFPWLPVGWFWFAGTLVPVIGVVQVGGQAMADRYTYFPAIGIFILLAWMPAEVLRLRPNLKQSIIAGSAILILLCAGLTYRQSRLWKDSETLFLHASRVTKNNYIALNNYGIALASRGELHDAIESFQRSIKIQPRNPNAHLNLGAAFFRLQQFEDAEAAFLNALKHQPGYRDARKYLGMLYISRERYREAREQFEAVLQHGDVDAEASYYLGTISELEDSYEQAIAAYRKAVETRPDYPDAHLRLGVLYQRNGDFDRALMHYERALPAYLDAPDLHYRMGNSLFHLGRFREAAARYKTVVDLAPQHAGAMYQLGLLAEKSARPEEARRWFEMVLRLRPDHEEARRKLAEPR